MKPRQSRGRTLRQTIRWTLGVTLLTLLVVGPALMLFTQLGLRMLVTLAPRIDLEVAGVEGSLVGGARASRLRYANESVLVVAEGVEVKVDWRCAVYSTVCLRHAHIEHLELDVFTSGGSREPVALPLPWGPDVEIDTLTINTLAVASGDWRERIDKLELRGSLSATQLRIDHLALHREDAALNASGSLNPLGQWRLVSQLQFGSLPSPEQLTLPLHYRLSASGDLQALQASLESPQNPQLRLDMKAQPRGDLLHLSGVAQGVTSLINNPQQLRGVEAVGGLTFDVTLGNALLDLQLIQDLAGIEARPLTVAVHLQADGSDWQLKQAELRRDGELPRVEVSGPLGTPTALTPRLQLRFLDFTPVPEFGRVLERVNGSASLQFAIEDVVNSWQLQSEALVLDIAAQRYVISADLRAADKLPAGSAQVQGRGLDDQPLTLMYARGDEVDAAARVWSPEAITYQHLSFSNVDLELVPGAELQMQLRTRGDIETTFRVRSRESATGAEFSVEPFVLAYQGQSIRSDAAVHGRWRRDARTFEIDAICLIWRESSVCGENLRLGEQGEVNLALSVHEDYRGEVSGKPFAVAGRGKGEVGVRWRERVLEYADVDLDFSQLSFDAFAASNTSAPVVFDVARVKGRLDPTGETLTVELTSPRAGALTGAFSRRSGELDGELRLDALGLVALDDMLPELDLHTGQIDGRVRVAGTLSHPRFEGRLNLRDGAATLSTLETELVDVDLDLISDAQSLVVHGTAMLGSGPVRVEGVCCDDERFRLTIEGDRNRLRHAVGLDVVASSRLALDFTRESLTVRGDVDVHEGLLEHNALPDGGVPISRDVIRVDTPDGPVRRFMLVADLGTHIEPGFTLRTSMLEATLGGDLRLQRRADDSTSLFGDLQVLGGELRAYGQTLRLGDGSVGFLGDPLNPDLNLSAEREIRGENLRVGFRVRGSLDEPELVLFSDPQLPERETLSYLVRGRGPDAGASVDGTAMALSLGASALNRSGVLAPLESIPGLSDVSLSAEGSDDDVAATISAYVGRRLYLSYGVGLYEPISALTARLYLRSRLWLEVVSRLESSFDLYYRFDID